METPAEVDLSDIFRPSMAANPGPATPITAKEDDLLWDMLANRCGKGKDYRYKEDVYIAMVKQKGFTVVRWRSRAETLWKAADAEKRKGRARQVKPATTSSYTTAEDALLVEMIYTQCGQGKQYPTQSHVFAALGEQDGPRTAKGWSRRWDKIRAAKR